MNEEIEVLFGNQDEWAEFAKTHRLFMERFANLRAALEAAFIRKSETSDPVDRVVFFSGRLCVEDFFEILLLCANGYGVGGWKILRGMYERAVTAQYLHLRPEEIEAFFDFYWVSMHKLTKALEETMGKDTPPVDEAKTIDAEYERVKGRFMVTDCKKCGTKRMNHTWSKLNFVAMAKAAGAIGKLIVPAYYLPLRHAHSTVGAVLDRLEATEGGGLGFYPGPQRKEAHAALRTAHHVMLLVLRLQLDHFKLESCEPALQKCFEDFVEIWRETDPEATLDARDSR